MTNVQSAQKAGGFGRRLELIASRAKIAARVELNKRPHYVPIDLNTFKLTFNHLGIDTSILRKAVDSVCANYSKLSMSAFNRSTAEQITAKLKRGPLAITHNKEIIGVLFSSFEHAGQRLLTELNTKVSAALGIILDRGHLASKSTLAKTPLQIKLNLVKEALECFKSPDGAAKVDRLLTTELLSYYTRVLNSPSPDIKKQALKELKLTNISSVLEDGKISEGKLTHTIEQSIMLGLGDIPDANIKKVKKLSSDYTSMVKDLLQELETRSTYGNIIVESEVVKQVRPGLAKISANIIILQESVENRILYGSKIESVIDSKLRNQLIKDILDLRLSPTIKESIANNVVDTLLGNPLKEVQATKIIKAKTKANKVSLAPTISNKKFKADLKKAPTRLQDTRGRFQSVVNLQALISAQLTAKVVANMREPRLVNRSGRFANSVELKALAYDNRRNTVNAFLSYMKYPYQTFEPGYKQGSTQRDPRALIVKSVREVASMLTIARLKAVIV
jgi:hypothetical protein